MLKTFFLALLLAAAPSWAATVTITQGDTPTITLTAQTGSGTNFDLTGATFQTQILGPNGTIATFANSKHTADPDQTTNTGKFTLTLTAADTALIGVGVDREIVTKVTQGSSVTYFHGVKVLTVLPNKPVR